MMDKSKTNILSSEERVKRQVLTIRDRSNYFVGLLLLIVSDGQVLEPERKKLIEIADLLDFESAYCEKVISNVSENIYIQKEPVKFSTIEIAKAFIVDGICLAAADGDFSPNESDWLKSVALINGIPLSWLELMKKSIPLQQNRTSWSVTKWWPTPS